MTDDSSFDLSGQRIWVVGHQGMVGSAVIRRLKAEPCTILTVPRRELDLRRQSDVESWIEQARPDAVILAAAKVGGILANSTYPADFLYDNLMIEANVIQAANQIGVRKLLFLGSSCIYPKHARLPLTEDQLLTGTLEPTNEWYAVAKIAGIKLCAAFRRQYGRDYISAMPTNLYGPGDNFHPDSSHVIPALIRRIHEAKQKGLEKLTIWGTGRPLREFMHVDDLADALILLLARYSDDVHVNIGSGTEISISELAFLLCDVIGWSGKLEFDTSMPDGVQSKLMDSSKINGFGWHPRIGIRQGLEATYRWYQENQDHRLVR